jgi:hypothetical protein
MATKKRTKPSAPQKKQELIDSLEDIERALKAIPAEYDYIFSPGKHLLFSYLRGMIQALGALTAVVIVIPFIIWIMTNISWVPLIGDFVADIQERIEQTTD